MRKLRLPFTYIRVDYQRSSSRYVPIPYWIPPAFPDVFALLTNQRRQEEDEVLEILRLAGSQIARAALDVAEVIAQVWTQIKAGFARLINEIGAVWDVLASIFSPPVPVTS